MSDFGHEPPRIEPPVIGSHEEFVQIHGGLNSTPPVVQPTTENKRWNSIFTWASFAIVFVVVTPLLYMTVFTNSCAKNPSNWSDSQPIASETKDIVDLPSIAVDAPIRRLAEMLREDVLQRNGQVPTSSSLINMASVVSNELIPEENLGLFVNQAMAGEMLSETSEEDKIVLAFTGENSYGSRLVLTSDWNVTWVTTTEFTALSFENIDSIVTEEELPIEMEMRKIEVDGNLLFLPIGFSPGEYKVVNTSKGARQWNGSNGAFIRIEAHDDVASDQSSIIYAEEARFKRSSQYKYERVRIRTGAEAFMGGSIWNFRLSRNGGPVFKRTIAYFALGDRQYAISLGYDERFGSDFGDEMTEFLNGIHDWAGCC